MRVECTQTPPFSFPPRVYLNDGVEHQLQVGTDAVEGFKAKDKSAFPQTEWRASGGSSAASARLYGVWVRQGAQ